MQYIENRTFEEIQIGDTAELIRTLKPEDIELFAVVSGDVNPAHVDEEYAKSAASQEVIAHGMWGGALISGVLGTELPGPGAVYLKQTFNFLQPVGLGDEITSRVTVTAKSQENHSITLDCICLNQDGETVISGQAEVIAPTTKIRRPRVGLPEVHLHDRGKRHEELIRATKELEPIRTAVVHPCDEISLSGALEAKLKGLIDPVLIGPTDKIKLAARGTSIDLQSAEIVDAPHSHAAAQIAADMARTGDVQAIMKGKIHTDELMDAIVLEKNHLRTERRMSHIFVLDVPHYPKPLYVTDAAINIYPDLNTKRDIVQNAIDLAQALGVACPKVAILSAVETVNAKIGSTLDAAALCKMADRGQITGGLLDGPLAFDNAISRSAAETKGIVSEVAGDADILLAPDLEAGNMIAKQLIYLAGADSAGIVLGARVPVILTSRADGILSRLASSALAQLFVHHRAEILK